MLGTIRQEVTVQQNGIVTVYSPELRAGLRAEVIVILKESPMSQPQPTVQNEAIETQPTLSELLNHTAAYKERITLIYQKQVFLAMVPIEDVDVVKQLKKCMSDYTQTQLETIRVDNALGDFLETKARLTLTYQDKVFLAVASRDDFDLIEALEDCIDNADADDALKEEGESLTSEQVDKILGW